MQAEGHNAWPGAGVTVAWGSRATLPRGGEGQGSSTCMRDAEPASHGLLGVVSIWQLR